jgi:hypothetical protein
MGRDLKMERMRELQGMDALNGNAGETEIQGQDDGHPSRYPGINLVEAEMLSRLGYTDSQMAGYFEVTLPAFKKYRKLPEVRRALRKGKQTADWNVARALFHRAIGYSHPDIALKTVGEEIQRVPIIKHYPPHAGAATAWLRCRRPAWWAEGAMARSPGPDPGPDIDPMEFSEDERRTIQEAIRLLMEYRQKHSGDVRDPVFAPRGKSGGPASIPKQQPQKPARRARALTAGEGSPHP